MQPYEYQVYLYRALDPLESPFTIAYRNLPNRIPDMKPDQRGFYRQSEWTPTAFHYSHQSPLYVQESPLLPNRFNHQSNSRMDPAICTQFTSVSASRDFAQPIHVHSPSPRLAKLLRQYHHRQRRQSSNEFRSRRIRFEPPQYDRPPTPYFNGISADHVALDKTPSMETYTLNHYATSSHLHPRSTSPRRCRQSTTQLGNWIQARR